MKTLLVIAALTTTLCLVACRSSQETQPKVADQVVIETITATATAPSVWACHVDNPKILSGVGGETILYEDASNCLVHYQNNQFGTDVYSAFLPQTSVIKDAREGREQLEQEIRALIPAEACRVVWSVGVDLREYRQELSQKIDGCP